MYWEIWKFYLLNNDMTTTDDDNNDSRNRNKQKKAKRKTTHHHPQRQRPHICVSSKVGYHAIQSKTWQIQLEIIHSFRFISLEIGGFGWTFLFIEHFLIIAKAR